MAESPLDRLKRLSAEKKAAAQAQPVVKAEAATGEAGASVQILEEIKNAEVPNTLAAQASTSQEGTPDSSPVEQDSRLTEPAPGTNSLPVPLSASEPSPSNVPTVSSNHPLAMQFAELEAALLAQQPEFKTILRQIHRHLGQEPELVTMMSEQEIQMVVSGLVVFANAEIVAPAAAKTAKAKITAASKKVISADDL